MIEALRAFVAVAEEGSYGRAAQRLGTSEPSIGDRLRALESRYGLPLFERAGTETRLTAAGSRLLEHARRVLGALEELEQSLEALKVPDEQVVEVVANPVPGEAILPLLLPRFLELQPNARVRESIRGTEAAVERLLRQEADLGLVSGPFEDARLETALFARDEFALIAHRDHPLAGRGPLRLREVCQYPLVLRREGSSAQVALEAALSAAGVAPESIKIAAELGNISAVKTAVEAGLGVAFVPVCTLATSGPAGELRALPLAEDPPARDLLVLSVRGRSLSPVAERFRQYLLDDETLREVASQTRLPARLRPKSEVRASPAAGLEHDPLLPPPPPANPIYRLARLPRTPEESLVARLLAETYRGGRAELEERLADELRRKADDPLTRAPEVGVYGLQLYEEEARALLNRLLGDLLVEETG